MVSYRGRSVDKVKLLKKPIKEGYKVWVLRDSGYVYDWLWHSRVKGPEKIPKKGLKIDKVKLTDLIKTIKIYLAPIFTLILRLIQRLRDIYFKRVFCFFLDNLFLNVDVTQALLAL